MAFKDNAVELEERVVAVNRVTAPLAVMWTSFVSQLLLLSVTNGRRIWYW